MKWDGVKVAAKVKAEMRKGLRTGAEMVLAKSQDEVPFYAGPHTASSPDPGELQRSGTVNPSNGGDVQVISYNTPYAVKQHEELGYVHTKAGTKAKYLEDPLNANGDKVLKLVADAASQAMKG